MMKSLRKAFALCVSLLAAVGMQAADVNKIVYMSDITNWTEATTPAVQGIETSFEHQDVTFSTTGDMVIAPTKKINNRTGYVGLEAANKSGSIETSAIADVTTLEYVCTVGRGGGNGLKLEVKGDGDADWVTLENTTLTGTSTFTINVNRTNVKMRWTNITTTKAIYMTDIKIKSNVDESKVPSLASFTLNGASIDAKTYFNEASTLLYNRDIQLSKSVPMIGEGNPLGSITSAIGNVKSVTYNGDATQCTVNIVVNTNSDEVTYQLNATQYVDYTITYYDADGTTVLGTQNVEDQSAIGSFDVTPPTPAEGYAFRGWMKDTKFGEKATTNDIMTGNLALTALVTEIETANGTSRYCYMLNNPYYNNEKIPTLGPQERYFYPEDHEGFNPSNASYGNKTHGWIFKAGSTLNLLVGGEAYITFVTCSNNTTGTITMEGQTIDISLNRKEAGICVAHYTGAPGTLTLTFSNDTYLHAINVSNVADKGGALKMTNGYYEIPAGDADYFLTVLEYLNSTGGNAKMFLPNGTYDLGTTALTPVYANNISIIGQSMNATIIKNAPPAWNESINVSATLLNKSQNLYLQDLTIQNALDYYSAGSAGRAVTIMEQNGSKTICKNVKLLSYQDTYYTHTSQQGSFYWEDSEIHGTVDYVCGGGNVIYNRVNFVNESRSKTSVSGECTIAAPRADNGTENDFGYVMLDCRIKTLSSTFNYGRSWGHWSRLAWVRTTVEDPDKFSAPNARFTLAGMNSSADAFYEYGTMNADGTPNCPASRVLTFTHATGNKTYETILTDAQVADLTINDLFGDWHPDQIAAQVEISDVQEDATTVSWTNPTTEALAFVAYSENEKTIKWIETSEVMNSITKSELQSLLSTYDAKGIMVRAANGRGGFGPAVLICGEAPTAINNVEAAPEAKAAEGAFVIGDKVVIIKDGKQFTAAGARIK